MADFDYVAIDTRGAEQRGHVAAADIESARKAAVAELQAQSAALAVEVASKILRREVNDQDNARLVQESLQELASSRH